MLVQVTSLPVSHGALLALSGAETKPCSLVFLEATLLVF